MVEEEDSVRQAIHLLLATVPGERVMRQEYGCDLHRLVFSPNDDTTAGLAKHYEERALARWEPRIQILRLDALRVEEDSGRLDIHLEYRVRATQRTERLTFPLSLSGERI
jgi:phage baseplate assembly protein W